MKKKLFALCGLGVASATASAQGSLTLYGVADIYLETLTHQNAATPGGSGSLVRMGSGGKSGSRWGIKGAEALGGGWQAVFRLESGINLNNGTNSGGFDRSAWVGLQNDRWGTLRLGRQYTTLFDVMEHYSPTIAYSTIYEPAGAIVGVNFRENNMAKYRVTFGPVAIQAHYAFGGTPGSFRSGAASGIGFEYTGAALSVAAAYDNVNGTQPADITHFRRYAASAIYTVGAAQLIAGFTHANGNVTTPGVVARFNFYWLGTRYQVSPALQVIGAFYYEDIGKQNPAAGQPAPDPENPKQITVQFNYALSKATTLYLTSGYAWRAALDFDNYNYRFLNYSLASNRSSSLGIAVGMRKLF
ncbi:porin [Burkholderia lata]|uniref:Porin n=1 Tax=Burkholderia lata (strain ATCC 17760 / DSM 23089 / LMG 22485 / NCIMB 9086 / R18194 / 383) TaxID=482957 RepID=A0A6P2I937_BURL3|nr:porin [Burkholderia lata]VWB25942.1 porin [Burkholderia lata]